MVNIQRLPESLKELNRAEQKRIRVEKSKLSDYRPFGHNYDLCLGSSESHSLVREWISTEIRLGLRNIWARGAMEELECDLRFTKGRERGSGEVLSNRRLICRARDGGGATGRKERQSEEAGNRDVRSCNRDETLWCNADVGQLTANVDARIQACAHTNTHTSVIR